MMGLEMLLKMMGLTPEHFEQSIKMVQGAAERLDQIKEQLDRIERNTVAIYEGMGDTAAAAPTNYDHMISLDKLPAMDNEIPAAPYVETSEPNRVILFDGKKVATGG